MFDILKALVAILYKFRVAQKKSFWIPTVLKVKLQYSTSAVVNDRVEIEIEEDD